MSKVCSSSKIQDCRYYSTLRLCVCRPPFPQQQGLLVTRPRWRKREAQVQEMSARQDSPPASIVAYVDASTIRPHFVLQDRRQLYGIQLYQRGQPQGRHAYPKHSVAGCTTSVCFYLKFLRSCPGTIPWPQNYIRATDLKQNSWTNLPSFSDRITKAFFGTPSVGLRSE
jgi:hypothetical protein